MAHVTLVALTWFAKWSLHIPNAKKMQKKKNTNSSENQSQILLG
jgi:hypothetical protein